MRKKLENKKISTEELEKEIDKILKTYKNKREICELPLSNMAHLNNQKWLDDFMKCEGQNAQV